MQEIQSYVLSITKILGMRFIIKTTFDKKFVSKAVHILIQYSIFLENIVAMELCVAGGEALSMIYSTKAVIKAEN